MEGFKRIEKEYGIKVRDDSFYSPRTGRMVKCFKIFTADGCQWENGLSRQGVKDEVEEWGKAFKEIASKAKAR